MRGIDPEDFPPFYQLIYSGVEAMRIVQQATPMEGLDAFHQAKRLLEQTRKGNKVDMRDRLAARVYQAVVRRIARDSGGPAAGLWSIAQTVELKMNRSGR